MKRKMLISVFLCMLIISACFAPAYAIPVTRTLSRGMEGDDVLYIQDLLSALEYYDGARMENSGMDLKPPWSLFKGKMGFRLTGKWEPLPLHFLFPEMPCLMILITWQLMIVEHG